MSSRSAGVSPAESEWLNSPPRGWHSRGYLPHFDGGDSTQSVSIRLWDSLPREVLERIREGLEEEMLRDPVKAAIRKSHLIEKCLDRGFGSCLLRLAEVAAVVEDALLFFDGERYQMHAWCVMPNHVHALFTPDSTVSMSVVLHSWKSFTTHRINAKLGRRGTLWQEDYFDRFIRNQEHFENALDYIHANPVRAGLCARPQDWQFTSARYDRPEGAGETPALRREETT